MSSGEKVENDMGKSGRFLGVPAPLNFGFLESDFRTSSEQGRISEGSGFGWHLISRDLRFSEVQVRHSIRRFSSKFFGKRRKRRDDWPERYLKAIKAFFRTKIRFSEDTGVFQAVIVVIFPQFETMISTEPLRWSQNTSQFVRTQFAESNFRASGPSNDFTVCIQLVFSEEAFNSLFAKMLSIRSLTICPITPFAEAVNSGFGAGVSIRCRSFELLWFPPLVPPEHSILATFEVCELLGGLKFSEGFAESSLQSDVASQFFWGRSSSEFSYLPRTPVLETESAAQRGRGQPTVLRPAFWAADESGRIQLETEECSRRKRANSTDFFSKLSPSDCNFSGCVIPLIFLTPFLHC
jgi:hypothetical protein